MAAEGSAVPIELFYHICENLPKDTLTNVAQANSSFKDVSEKLMYRRLHLNSTDQALRCCQTVVKKPSAAQAVQELIIMIEYVFVHVVEYFVVIDMHSDGVGKCLGGSIKMFRGPMVGRAFIVWLALYEARSIPE